MRTAIAFLAYVAIISLPTSASAIVFDGIKTNADGYANHMILPWTNNHHTAEGNGCSNNVADPNYCAPYENVVEPNPIFFYTNTESTKDAFGNDNMDGVLEYFVEVPTYAKNMIWAEDKSNLDPAHVAAYEAGTHHSSWNSSYSTATKSEHFVLKGTAGLFGNDDLCFELDHVDSHCDPDQIDVSQYPNIEWKTSLDWLLGAGQSECGDITGSGNNDETKNCAAYGRSMSLEVRISMLGMGEGINIVNQIDGLILHLSDEARGLPVPEVPVPAAFWLFGTALIGFIGISRRTNLS